MGSLCLDLLTRVMASGAFVLPSLGTKRPRVYIPYSCLSREVSRRNILWFQRRCEHCQASVYNFEELISVVSSYTENPRQRQTILEFQEYILLVAHERNKRRVINTREFKSRVCIFGTIDTIGIDILYGRSIP